MLENDASRQELIGQLRKVATAPPAEPVPTIVPPTLTEEKTVLENVTDVTRHYGEALSSRFAQLYRNITDAPHKTFNPQTFTNALTHFLMLAMSVFGFSGWFACARYRCIAKWDNGRGGKTANAATGFSFRR